MTVTLTNTSGRLKTFTLPHESYCMARGRCSCTKTSGRDARRVSSLTLATDARLSHDETRLASESRSRAVRFAQANQVLRSQLHLGESDVALGTIVDPDSLQSPFVPASAANANSVRVTVHRSAGCRCRCQRCRHSRHNR